MKQVLIPVIFLLLVSACGVSNDPNIEPEVELKLTVKDKFGQEEDTFTQGEDIEFILTITNHTEEKFIVPFPRLELRITTLLDIEILDTGGTFGGVSQLVVEPNETKVRRGIWDQKLLNGEIIPPGEYTAYVYINGYPVERKQKITIQ